MAVGDMKVINERAVYDGAFAMTRVEEDLRLEGLAALSGRVFEEGLEGGADGSFVGDAETGDLVEGGAVGFNGSVGEF